MASRGFGLGSLRTGDVNSKSEDFEEEQQKLLNEKFRKRYENLTEEEEENLERSFLSAGKRQTTTLSEEEEEELAGEPSKKKPAAGESSSRGAGLSLPRGSYKFQRGDDQEGRTSPGQSELGEEEELRDRERQPTEDGTSEDGNQDQGGDGSGDGGRADDPANTLVAILGKVAKCLERISDNKSTKSEPKELKLPTLSKRDPTSWRAWRLRVENYLLANRWDPDRECEMIMCALADDALRATGTFKRPIPGQRVAFRRANGTIGTRPYSGQILLDRLEQKCFVTEQTEEYNRMLLESIHQKPHENVPDLAARYKEQFLLAWPDVAEMEGQVDGRGKIHALETNKQLIHGFLSAITSNDVAEWAKAFKPTTFSKAIQLAAHKEATIYSLKNKPKAGLPPKPPAFMQEMSVDKGSMQAVSGGFQGQCHLCGTSGHSWRNCSMAKKYQELKNKGANSSSGKPNANKPGKKPNSKKPKKDKEGAVQQMEVDQSQGN